MFAAQFVGICNDLKRELPSIRRSSKLLQGLIAAACVWAHSPDSHAETEYLKGQIDGKHQFWMQFRAGPYECSGTYSYLRERKPIALSGTCKGSLVRWSERPLFPTGQLARSNEISGERAADGIRGSWRSADGSRTYSFTAVPFVPTKRGMLQHSVGTHRLHSISSSYGANAMGDIYKNKMNGDWRASTSAVSGGMREGQDVALSKKEKAVLSALRVIVDEQLTIELKLGDKLVARFPYTDDVLFDMKNMSAAEASADLFYSQYVDGKSFHNGVLNLAVSDSVDLLGLLQFGDLPIEGEHGVMIDYDLNGFTLHARVKKSFGGGRVLSFVKY